MKADVDEVDTNKFVNCLIGLINVKAKVDDLYLDKLKTAPADLKTLRDVVIQKVVKNTVLNVTKWKSKQFRKWNSWCVYFNSDKSMQRR